LTLLAPTSIKSLLLLNTFLLIRPTRIVLQQSKFGLGRSDIANVINEMW
jgi:hypothetical protein